MLIPNNDPEDPHFTCEPRHTHPYDAGWNAATLIALSDLKVLVCGVPWITELTPRFNPWIYCLNENKWTNEKYSNEEYIIDPNTRKRIENPHKDDHTLLPLLDRKRRWGAGCYLGETAYLFGGKDKNNQVVPFIERLHITLDGCGWKTGEWEKIETHMIAQEARFEPFVAPVSPTGILLFGGT